MTQSIFSNGSHLPCPNPFNLSAHVLNKADDIPDKIALLVLSQTKARRISYDALKKMVLATAQSFLDLGLNSGDKILFRLGNTIEFPIAYLAAIAVDIIPVPLSSTLTENDINNICERLEPKLILHDPKLSLSNTKTQILDLQQLQKFTHGNKYAQFRLGCPDRPAYIMFTSGTSGQAQAVVHAHRAIWARQMMVNDWYDLRSDDRLLHAGAFNWSFTLGTGLMDPWTIGATAMILDTNTPLSSLPLLLKRHDATLFAAVPSVFRKIIKEYPELHLSKLRHGLSAGEKLGKNTYDGWLKSTGTQIYEAFGMSECSTFISSNPHTPPDVETLGIPQSGRKVAIVNPNTGMPLKYNETGIIAISNKDQGLMVGYYSKEGLNLPLKNNWFLTGDLGAMSSNGTIKYHGRNDDMMNAGGFRVSPIEVETVLAQHPDIIEVATIDVEVKSDTRIIAAFYISKKEIPHDNLDQFAKTHLAPYKCPKQYQRLSQLPTNGNGKLKRKKLRLLMEGANK